MHREIRDEIEKVLAGSKSPAAGNHLDGCSECREEIQIMADHAAMMRELRAPSGAAVEPRAGFYARVRERIEAQGAVSIWNLFIESAFGRRIAYASLALVLLLGVYVVSSEHTSEQANVTPRIEAPGSIAPVIAGEDAPGAVLTRMDQPTSSEDDVLVNLVTYHEQ